MSEGTPLICASCACLFERRRGVPGPAPKRCESCTRDQQRVYNTDKARQYREAARDRAARHCDQCGKELPDDSRTSRTFCSQRCGQRARRATLSFDGRREVRQRYAKAEQACRDRRREAQLNAREQRHCPECGSTLARDANPKRIFCSIHCINQSALRKMRPEPTQRHCRVCQEPLPFGAWKKQVYCSRQCVNKMSLLTKKEMRREHFRKYRARKKGNGGTGVSATDWARLLRRFGHRCVYCGGSRNLSADHIIPVIRGGKHSIGNVLPACRSCNSSKKHRLLADWRRWRAAQGRPILL